MLEVGLGGRLDAVNLLDADCAVLTSVAIDHVDYLGRDRESIGREKAGIFRAGRPAVIAEPDPPRAVLQAPGEKLSPGEAIRLSRRRRTSGPTGGPPGSAPGLPIRRCAARCSCATPRRRSARSTRCASAAGRDAGRAPRARRGHAARALPGAARPAAGDPRRRAQPRGGARRSPPTSAASGFAPETIAVVRHAARQGHRRRAARARAAHHALAPRVAAGTAGAHRRRISTASPGRHCSAGRKARFTARVAGAPSPRRGRQPSENDKIVVFGSFLTVAEVMAWLKQQQDVDALKRRGRSRLVGAIALVLAAVIVLPMVFDPEPRGSAPPVSVRIPGEDETPFTPKLTPKPAEKNAQACEPRKRPATLSRRSEYVVQVGSRSPIAASVRDRASSSRPQAASTTPRRSRHPHGQADARASAGPFASAKPPRRRCSS